MKYKKRKTGYITIPLYTNNCFIKKSGIAGMFRSIKVINSKRNCHSIVVFFISATIGFFLAGCGLFMDSSSNEGGLKLLTEYAPYSINDQPSNAVVKEITGSDANFYMLPSVNAEIKLFLEIAGGADYDLLYRINAQYYKQLADKNALLDLKPYLEEYGQDILETVGEEAWETVTVDGAIYGIPHEAVVPKADEPYGLMTGGIGIRSDVLEELGMELPHTLPQFTEFLRAAKKKYRFAPLTANKSSIYSPHLKTALGLGEPLYYNINGDYVSRVFHPRLTEYLEYMQMLYSEGLIDRDMPVNTFEGAMEKLANKSAAALAPMSFWHVPSMLRALELNNQGCKVVFATNLAAYATTKPIAYISEGVKNVSCIPKTGKDPAGAIRWFNEISKANNFKRIYIGQEGVSYYVQDEKYYPIFPAFDDYANADKFTGVSEPAKAYDYWQARARKTPEMAEAYEQMNSRIDEYEIITNIENYAFNQPNQEQRTALVQDFTDSFIKAIVSGNEPESAVDEMQAQWIKNGGGDADESMRAWYSKTLSQ